MSTNPQRRQAVTAPELPSSETSSISGDSASGQEVERFPLFRPCSATAALFLFAYKNIVYCLRHDTLALERKLVKHKADISIVAADNVSERHAGRLAVSYDVGTNAIVWDLFSGTELARFASYEFVRVASWLMDGRLAFGDVRGSITLFEPTTSEHLTITTIFDPINAIAQSPNCGMFAIGYENGSILICQLEPSFAILHSLSSIHGPASIASLAWHGTLTKQRTEMLAVQSVDGDLRVWGVPKASDDIARMLRVINAPENIQVQMAWSSWSKSGRLIQYCDGDTRAWDVRVRNIKWEPVPTAPDVIGISVYGPSATLFTITSDYRIQQYDLIGQGAPILVAEASHLETIGASSEVKGKNVQTYHETTARSVTEGDEAGQGSSPFEQISKGKEVERYDDEERDKLGPLSPASSKASVSSVSSYGRRHRATAQRHATPGSEITVFSNTASAMGRSTFSNRDRASRSGSATPALTRSSALRQEIFRSPADTYRVNDADDLFPHVRARLAQVQLKIPQTGQDMTVTDLQREMLSVIFDWPDTVITLLRDEQQRHITGSAGSVLLSKWVGESGTDALAQMVGSESMTSSDWMLLALSAQIGQGSQRAVGEAFVRRLLDVGEVNSAVAVLLGMEEKDIAVEVYSTRQCFLEAVLLNCTVRSYHWDSQAQLLRRWGETLVAKGQTEAAVRCFACASMTPSRGYVSASTTDESGTESDLPPFSSPPLSTPVSPPTARTRLAAMNAPLKLVTTFDNSRASSSRTPDPTTVISMEPGETWRHTAQSSRERSESRTATPGSYTTQRLPSGSTRTSSSSRHHTGSGSGSTTRASSSQRLGPLTADVGTPSSVMTARPGGSGGVEIRGERANTGRQASHRLPTPDISITAPAGSEQSGQQEGGSPRFLDDISRRVSNVISMQQAHSPDTVPPALAVRGHARRASDNLAQQRSSPAPVPHIYRPGSADVPRRSLDTGSRSQLSTKELAARELEERRRSLLRRPSIPAIPHPSELVPRTQSNAGSAAGGFQGELSTSTVYSRGLGIERSATADPTTMTRHGQPFGEYLHQSEFIPSSTSGTSGVTSPDESTWLAGSSTFGMDGPTLPSTVYQRPVIPRSMTAPPEDPAVTAMRRRNSSKPNRQLANIDEAAVANAGPSTPPSHTRSRARPSLDADGDVFPEFSQPDILAVRRRQNSSPPPPPPPPPPPIFAPSNSSPTAMSMDVPLTLDDSASPSNTRTHRPGVLSSGSRRPSLDRITAAVTRRIRSASRSGNQSQSQSTNTGSPITRMVSPPYETVLDVGVDQEVQRGGGTGTVMYRHPREVRERVAKEAREREGGS